MQLGPASDYIRGRSKNDRWVVRGDVDYLWIRRLYHYGADSLDLLFPSPKLLHLHFLARVGSEGAGGLGLLPQALTANMTSSCWARKALPREVVHCRFLSIWSRTEGNMTRA